MSARWPTPAYLQHKRLGELTDLSNIPLSAVERIDILKNGASAIYGSDAVAGVINIITRRDYDAADVSVRYSSSQSGADANQFDASFSTGWGSGDIGFTLSYEHQDRILTSDLVTTQDFTSQGGQRSPFLISGPVPIFFDQSVSKLKDWVYRRVQTSYTFPEGEVPSLDNVITSTSP